jgi:wobble nucleotide-excising tRNase
MRKSTTGRRAYGSLDWQSVLDVTESNEICSLEQGIDNLDLEISRNRKRVKTIVELLIDTPSESLKEDLLETEQKLKAQTTQKAELEKTLNTAKVRHSNLVSTDVVYYQLAGLKDLESHARLREEIRRKVARIDVTFGVEIIVAGASEVNGVRTRYWS